MEVHHHAHTSRKKWTHYFWEFLMLFLAVFCGFIAENIREHKAEQHRAKELAKNLYKEILADSFAIQEKIDIRDRKENETVFFINYVKDSSLTTLSPRFYPSFTWAFLQSAQLMFEPNDGILTQLRNSGELRYFKSSELQAAVGKLSIQITNLRNRNDKEYSFLEMNIRPFTLRHFDFQWYKVLTADGEKLILDALTQNPDPSYSGKILNADKFSRQEAENLASYYLLMLRGTRQTQYLPYVRANHQLLEVLRKEYHLE
ncbi:MAG: hypothetical protein ABIT05_08495 [Chitinophagaceae bacterium]